MKDRLLKIQTERQKEYQKIMESEKLSVELLSVIVDNIQTDIEITLKYL